MKYAVYFKNGKVDKDLIYDTYREALEAYEFVTGDPNLRNEYRGAYVDTYIRTRKTKKKPAPFGL